MNFSYIGFFVGALIPTFLISRLILAFMKKWDGGIQKIALANFVSLVICGFLGGMGMADGGAFAGTTAIAQYALPQLLCFSFDMFKNSRSKRIAEKTSEA